MGKQWDPGWRDFKMGTKAAPGSTTAQPTDRGSRSGAKRCIVNDDLQLIDHATAKAAGIKGVFFQSRKEAKYYIGLEVIRRVGRIRPLPGQEKWRQVRFPLFAIRPDGLKETIAHLVLDFAYEALGGSIERDGERVNVWVPRYEDVKPSGGHREDAYLLKKKWFEAQYGIQIVEV